MTVVPSKGERVERWRMKIVVTWMFVFAFSLYGKAPQFPAKEEEACASGDMEACYRTAQAYLKGLGVLKDPEIAREYFMVSCDAGLEKSCSAIKVMGKKSQNASSPTNDVESVSIQNSRKSPARRDPEFHLREKTMLARIVRHGIARNMVIYAFWSGEYPRPVIQIKGVRNGWTTVQGYRSLSEPKRRRDCTVRSGIYHPWSDDEISLIDYYSLIPQVNYTALKNTKLDERRIKRGDRLYNEVYLAEGSCTYKLNNRKYITTTCIENAIEGSIENSREFRRTKAPAHPREQWLYLRCREGYNVFVQDRDLLQQPNVTKGKITGYGKVKASGGE